MSKLTATLQCPPKLGRSPRRTPRKTTAKQVPLLKRLLKQRLCLLKVRRTLRRNSENDMPTGNSPGNQDKPPWKRMAAPGTGVPVLATSATQCGSLTKPALAPPKAIAAAVVVAPILAVAPLLAVVWQCHFNLCHCCHLSCSWLKNKHHQGSFQSSSFYQTSGIQWFLRR